MFGWANTWSRMWIWNADLCEPLGPSLHPGKGQNQLPYTHAIRASSPIPGVRCLPSSPDCEGFSMMGWANSTKRAWTSSLMRGRPRSAAVSSKGLGWLSQGKERAGLAHHDTLISIHKALGTPTYPETKVTDINSDCNCSWTANTDIVFCSSLGPNVTMAPLAEQVTQVCPWQHGHQISGD